MASTAEPRTNGWYLQYNNLITVVERAIATRHYINGEDVRQAPKLRETGEYIIDNYTGRNEFILKQQLRIWNGASITDDQIAAVWRRLKAEYTVAKLASRRRSTSVEQRTGKTRAQAQAEIDELFPQ